jgi:hypothetical protein
MWNAKGDPLVAIDIAIFTLRDYGVNGALNLDASETEGI